MRSSLDPYFVELAKPIAQRVVYPFSLVYDMVLMGLTGDEIEKLCRAGASVGLPVEVPYRRFGMFPDDMYKLARVYVGAKTQIVLENMAKALHSEAKEEEGGRSHA